MEKVPTNVSIADTVSGRLINITSYSFVTVKEVGAKSNSDTVNETSKKIFNSRYSVFVGYIHTEDSNEVGGAHVATNESIKAGSSDIDSTMVIGKIAGENTKGRETKDMDTTCFAINLHSKIGGTVASKGNSVFDGLAAKRSVAVEETTYYKGVVRAPDREEDVSSVTHDGKTNFGEAAATRHEGFKGGLGTRETSNLILVTTGSGSGNRAVSTIDGCPLGVIRGVVTGYALFEVVAGGLTVSAEEGDTTETDTFVNITNSSALDEESVKCKVERKFC